MRFPLSYVSLAPRRHSMPLARPGKHRSHTLRLPSPRSQTRPKPFAHSFQLRTSSWEHLGRARALLLLGLLGPRVWHIRQPQPGSKSIGSRRSSILWPLISPTKLQTQRWYGQNIQRTFVLTFRPTHNVRLTASACNAPAGFLTAQPFRVAQPFASKGAGFDFAFFLLVLLPPTRRGDGGFVLGCPGDGFYVGRPNSELEVKHKDTERQYSLDDSQRLHSMVIPWAATQLDREDTEQSNGCCGLVRRHFRLPRDIGSDRTKVGADLLAPGGLGRRRGTAVLGVDAWRKRAMGPKRTRSRWKSSSPERRP